MWEMYVMEDVRNVCNGRCENVCNGRCEKCM